MSSSGLCQGLQSCVDPLALEQHFLSLKLAPQEPNFSPPSEWTNTMASISDSDAPEKSDTTDDSDLKEHKNADEVGWSFLQAFADTSYFNKTEKPETEKVYVHPMVKRFSSVLSLKSLEMCTECLGCENGTNPPETPEDIALFSSPRNTSLTTPTPTLKSATTSVSKSFKRPTYSFPPPLSSITERGGVQVRPHRQDGRLILKAVAYTSPLSYFKAERSNGRLRLRLFRSSNSYYDEVADDEEIGEEDEEEAETFNQNICGEEDAEAEDMCCDEELNENNDNDEDETGTTKLQRSSMCHASGNNNQKNMNWGPFWVAT